LTLTLALVLALVLPLLLVLMLRRSGVDAAGVVEDTADDTMRTAWTSVDSDGSIAGICCGVAAPGVDCARNGLALLGELPGDSPGTDEQRLESQSPAAVSSLSLRMLTRLPSAVLIESEGAARRGATDVVRVELYPARPRCMGVLVAAPGVDRTLLASAVAGLGELGVERTMIRGVYKLWSNAVARARFGGSGYESG
ncbi:hypothetical protein H4R23_004076, partial [Coemansia sp. Cherry 401B]